MLTSTWSDALTWRLARHHLDPVGPASVAEVVGDLVAVAAQLDPAVAELGLRLRRRASEPGDVGRAVAEGTLVRTFAFRGAVHLMTPASAATHLALRASSRMWERPSWRSFYRLEPSAWPALRAAVREALAGGPLTRTELASAITASPRFAHLGPAFTDPAVTFLKPLAWQGDLSIAPSRDGQLTLQSLEGNPAWPGLPTLDDAGPRAVEAYVRAYGPASPDNLRYWLVEGLGVRRALVPGWVDALGDRLLTVEVDGEPRLVHRDDVDAFAAARAHPVVRLLPKYDPWVLGPGTADVRVVPPDLRQDVSRGAHLVVAGGVVVGTWTLARGEVVATVPDGVVAREDLGAEAARVAALAEGLVGAGAGRAGRARPRG
ncbi:DNA glycosylase AlkZ-like family protein [Actinotalea solisilvae]|uniref:DNA glycosylase AlkZ-like family protein n=1 Tax=Actinotalea solisilvae TaxID=2072922 RepID=UPI0027DB79BC|nr:crosslink repair DNA glycosylase YcaQ family protein [Actinotalea solisilvae]